MSHKVRMVPGRSIAAIDAIDEGATIPAECRMTYFAGMGATLRHEWGTRQQAFRRPRSSGAPEYPVGSDEPGLSAYCIGI